MCCRDEAVAPLTTCVAGPVPLRESLPGSAVCASSCLPSPSARPAETMCSNGMRFSSTVVYILLVPQQCFQALWCQISSVIHAKPRKASQVEHGKLLTQGSKHPISHTPTKNGVTTNTAPSRHPRLSTCGSHDAWVRRPPDHKHFPTSERGNDASFNVTCCLH